MAHKWEFYQPPHMSNAELFMNEPFRRCAHCGKVQQRHTEHSWMRVVGYKWLPKAGRCTVIERKSVTNAGNGDSI
jgi:hypothetical protein